MKKNFKILVTGVGGAIGIGIIKSLRKEFGRNIRIMGADSSAFAPSFYRKNFLDDFFIVPKANDEKYIGRILDIAKTNKINLIFPGTDHEILPLSQKIKEFGDIKIIVSPPETNEICNDKWLTYEKLKNSLPIVKSFLKSNNLDKEICLIGLPVVVKPRFGWGSRDIYKADSIEEVKFFLKKVDRPVIQKWINGFEYTIDGLVNQKGKVICIVPRQRINVLAGLSSQGITIKNKELIELGKKLGDALKIRGPFNFQVRKENGKYFIFEINPRFAGTGILSVFAGANIPALAVKDALGMKMPQRVDFKNDILITRYIEDAFIHKKNLIQ